MFTCSTERYAQRRELCVALLRTTKHQRSVFHHNLYPTTLKPILGTECSQSVTAISWRKRVSTICEGIAEGVAKEEGLALS